MEILSNTILPAISARFFIYLPGIPHYINIFGFKVQSLALVIAVVLILAAAILLAGGSLALLITDTIQGLMTYPIIFVFTIFIIMNFSWWDEIVPVMADRVPGESFINPYDIQALRDFNLFAVFVSIFAGILNRGIWFGGSASSAARTAHEQKMAGILGTWRNGFNPLFYLLLRPDRAGDHSRSDDPSGTGEKNIGDSRPQSYHRQGQAAVGKTESGYGLSDDCP